MGSKDEVKNMCGSGDQRGLRSTRAKALKDDVWGRLQSETEKRVFVSQFELEN